MEDTRLITQISLEVGEVIGQISSPDKPVAFIGIHGTTLNPACRLGNTYGWGNVMGLWMERGDEVSYDRQVNTALAFQNSGLDYKIPTKEQYELAKKAAENMSVFPADGSIIELDEVIVVKLLENHETKARLD